MKNRCAAKKKAVAFNVHNQILIQHIDEKSRLAPMAHIYKKKVADRHNTRLGGEIP